MDDFTNNIKGHQSNDQHHDLPSDAWNSFEAFSESKDQENDPKPFMWWPWISGLLAAMLIGTIIYYNIGSSQERDFAQGTLTIHDTIYIEKWNEQNTSDELEKALAYTNSLEHKIVKSKSVLQARNYALTLHKNQINKINNEYNQLLNEYTIGQKKLSNLELFVKQSGIESIGTQSDKKLASAEDFVNKNHSLIGLIQDIPLVDYKYGIINPRYTSSPIKSSRRRPFLQNFVPKTFSIGLDFGAVYPTEYYGTNNAYGIMEAIVMNSYFTPRWRGLFEISNTNFFVEDKDPLPNTNIPFQTPPENGTLKEVKISNQSIQTTIGLEYILHKGNIWRPFIGLSYGIEMNLYPTFNFEYTTDQGELYQRLEQYRDPIYRSVYRINSGIEYHLNKSFDLQAHIAFQHIQNSTNLTSLKTRLLYHF